MIVMRKCNLCPRGCGIDRDENLYIIRECCESGLTLSEAAERVAELSRGEEVEYAVASPDLWNRRQDSGKSGFEIMQRVSGMPPLTRADDRRVPGWRVLREYLSAKEGGPVLRISEACEELIFCLPSLLCDKTRAEDASDTPHSVTHAPEALRYAVMSRALPPEDESENFSPFRFAGKKTKLQKYLS